MDIYDNIFLNLPKNETYQAKVVEKIKTQILCSIFFLIKSYRLWDNVEK